MDSLRCRTCPDGPSLVKLMRHGFIARSMGLEGMGRGGCVLVVKGEGEREEVERALGVGAEEGREVFRVEVENEEQGVM